MSWNIRGLISTLPFPLRTLFQDSFPRFFPGLISEHPFKIFPEWTLYPASLLSLLPSPPPPLFVQSSSQDHIFLLSPYIFIATSMKSRIDYRIRISYIMEKAAATLGSIGLMIVITEQYVLPTIQPILPSQTVGMTFIQKLGELGWVLLDMIFPYIPLSICLLSFVLFYLSS